MKKIGILYHPMKESSHAMVEKLQEFLRIREFEVWISSAWEEETAKSQLEGTDLILSVGGDGTILRAAHVVLPGKTPVTGINLGKLGFMTELSVDEALEKLPDLLSGKGWIDTRYMIQAKVGFPENENKPSKTFHALNDVVVARGAVPRAIIVKAIINGESMTTYKADGAIVSTATGSTGYALAAGGSIMHPQSKEFQLLPVAPHLSSSYSVILPSESILDLQVETVLPAVLSIDGYINLPISSGTTVTVKHSPKIVRFLRIHPEKSFYSYLEQRLKGKQ